MSPMFPTRGHWWWSARHRKRESLIEFEKMEENKYKKYDTKRKRINLAFTQSEQRKLTEKFGRMLRGPEIKKIIFDDELRIVTRNADPQLPSVINHLSKIGNNLNQITRIANEKRDVPADVVLTRHLAELRKTINFLRTYR